MIYSMNDGPSETPVPVVVKKVLEEKVQIFWREI